MAITAVPILYAGNQNLTFPYVINRNEAATQTFKPGTPVALSSGNVAAWGGTNPSGAAAIMGIAPQGGMNLTTAGVGQAGSFGAVPNQSAAFNYYPSGPIGLGQGTYYGFGNGNVFIGTFGNNGNAATVAVTDVGKFYGLTIDSGSNYWYVDKNKSTVGTSTAVQVIGIDQITGGWNAQLGTWGNLTANTLVLFVADPAVVQVAS